jgi:glutamine amidotransferase
MPGGVGARIPHMGWNTLRDIDRGCTLMAGIDAGEQMYFVHGYAASVTSDCVATSDHGDPFAAAVQRGRIFGAQFHPERSGSTGARVLANFLAVRP